MGTKTLEPIKLGRQFETKINGFRTQIGVVDRLNQYSTFNVIGVWVQPKDGLLLNEAVFKFKNQLKVFSYQCIKELFGNEVYLDRIIRNIDYSDNDNYTHANRIKEKYTFMSIEITLFFKNQIQIEDKDLNDRLKTLNSLIVDFLMESRELQCKGSKK